MDNAANSSRSQIVLVCQPDEKIIHRTITADGAYELVWVPKVRDAIKSMENGNCAGIYFSRDCFAQTQALHDLVIRHQVLNNLPNGVAVLDDKKQIEWYNQPLLNYARLSEESIKGIDFYKALGNPECLGPEMIPLDEALAAGTSCWSVLKWNSENAELEKSSDSSSQKPIFAMLQVSPLMHTSAQQTGQVRQLLVSLTDITREQHQVEKLEAIYKSGLELADITPDEMLEMSIEERTDMLKSNILYYTKQLMNFDKIEVRLLNEKTGELKMLLSQGMDAEEMDVPLYAKADGNGTSGFVAATRKYYLCEDTSNDPLYIQGAREAKSSLTVPIEFHDTLIGTFNVESLTLNAFDESDVRFLEIFVQQIAAILNTFQLLVTEKSEGAFSIAQSIFQASALPVDAILNDAALALDYLESMGPGSREHIAESLVKIENTVRSIKNTIRSMREDIKTEEDDEANLEHSQKPLLGLRVLLIDNDQGVRSCAHQLFDALGADVETADSGDAAAGLMRRATYNVVIIDIRLKDPSCIDFISSAKEKNWLNNTAVILMTDYGYDPGHTIPKARPLGITSVMYKPFRIDQVKNRVQEAIEEQLGAKPQPQSDLD